MGKRKKWDARDMLQSPRWVRELIFPAFGKESIRVNGYERMMTALRREEPDRVPVWELIVNEPVIKALYGDISYEDFVEKDDLDGITIFEDQRVTEKFSDTQYKDEWGILWTIEPNGIPYPSGGPIKTESDLDKYTMPDPDADHRLESLRSAVKRFKGEKAIVFLTHDAFEFSHYLHGMDNLLIDYLVNPDFTKRLAGIVMDYKKGVNIKLRPRFKSLVGWIYALMQKEKTG